MKKHFDLLDKKHLRTSGWKTTPLDNVNHDFISSLLKRYLKDLDERIFEHDREDVGIALSMRKITLLDSSKDLVDEQFN